jgi:hypothetical protein
MTARALAMLSLSVPQSPWGSAAVLSIPAIITLSKSVFHSSGVKSVLPPIGFLLCAPVCLILCLRVSLKPSLSAAADQGYGAQPFLFEKGPVAIIFVLPSCAAMAINGVEISSSDPGAVPGASTKARCQTCQAGFGGGEIGSTGSVKDGLLPGMVPPSSGRTYSCQRQLCSGCSRCVTR